MGKCDFQIIHCPLNKHTTLLKSMGRILQTSQAVDASVGFASSTESVTRIAYESILPDFSF